MDKTIASILEQWLWPKLIPNCLHMSNIWVAFADLCITTEVMGLWCVADAGDSSESTPESIHNQGGSGPHLQAAVERITTDECPAAHSWQRGGHHADLWPADQYVSQPCQSHPVRLLFMNISPSKYTMNWFFVNQLNNIVSAGICASKSRHMRCQVSPLYLLQSSFLLQYDQCKCKHILFGWEVFLRNLVDSWLCSIPTIVNLKLLGFHHVILL